VLEKVELVIQQGRFTEATDLISHLNPLQQLWGKIFTSRVLELTGEYQKAYSEAAEALAISIDEGRELEELAARTALSYALIRQHRYQECQTAIQIALDMVRELDFLPNNYRKVKKYEGILLNIRGLLHRYKGDLEAALHDYQDSLALHTKLAEDYYIAINMTNIGTIYQLMGEMERALNHHHNAEILFKQLDNQFLLSYVYNDMGGCYWEKNNYEQAREYYDMALKIRLHGVHDENTSRTLFDLVHLHLEFDYPDIARYYFDILEETAQQNTEILVQTYYQLAHASLLQQSSRLLQRAEAQQILMDLQTSTLPFELLVYAKMNLCNLLLYELKISKNEEILQQVETHIKELMRSAKKQFSISLLIEALMLRSKLALINLDLETAQNLLFQAEQYAHQKNLQHLAYKVSIEHDLLLNRLQRWELLQQRNASLIDRIEEVHLVESIDQLRTRRQQAEPDLSVDRSLFLLILNKDAVTVYSNTFGESVLINEELIGGFLLASDRGIGLALNNQGTIERIKYGTHQLMFVHYEKLVFCYGYEGPSYFAIKRIQNFVDIIKVSRSWQLLTAPVPRPKLITEDIAIKVHDYFGVDSIFSRQLLEQKLASPFFELGDRRL